MPNKDDSNKSLNPLFDENEVKRIRKVEEECKKISEWASVSYFIPKFMAINKLKDDESFSGLKNVEPNTEKMEEEDPIYQG